MKCKHPRSTIRFLPACQWGFRKVCEDCGEWLSLGPSNDFPHEVQEEIIAAEIAASPYAELSTYDFAWSGADVWHLARCIASHDEEQT